ncbi:hypothetical protein [Paracoccus alcaliphilus]|uniref:hypothetical protein n=1 Tax=Paracoccus alcaliphilus TaxID=34002 RepID=UPI000B821364|nr:hypothetical protein JHW40_07530 [Paracoccus alcaliphilus]
MDWHTRMVPAWRISNIEPWSATGPGTMAREADFCVEALNEAVYCFGTSGITNTDQGSQFISFAWTDRLRRTGTRIPMDGKGHFLDSIFIERLWWTLKYECVYLHAGETGSEAKVGIRKRNPTRSAGAESSLIYARSCPMIVAALNFTRPHGAFNGRTTHEALREKLQLQHQMSQSACGLRASSQPPEPMHSHVEPASRRLAPCRADR